jgi:hypothetical protein
MKVWVYDDCGREISGPRPEKCDCGSDALIEIERTDESSFGCKGPSV